MKLTEKDLLKRQSDAKHLTFPPIHMANLPINKQQEADTGTLW